MGTSAELDLHLGALPVETQQAFHALSTFSYLSDARWYLAGGTALALHVGHRQSVDLDFFTTQPDFDKTVLERQLQRLGDWSTTFQEAGTLYGTLCGAKVSFIANASFTPSVERVHNGTIALLLPCMMELRVLTNTIKPLSLNMDRGFGESLELTRLVHGVCFLYLFV